MKGRSTMSIQQYNVQYVNAIPGSGKTHWLQDALVKYMIAWQKRKDAKQYDKLLSMPQLMICVFPTNALIDEVVDKLKTAIMTSKLLSSASKRAICAKITCATYESLRSKHAYNSHNTVKQSIHRYAANFMYWCANLANNIIDESPKHAKLAHEFKDSLDFSNIPGNRFSSYDLFPGSVLLITQSAFWSANHSDFATHQNTASFSNRHLCNVYIDEARSCQMSSTSLKLSNVAKEYLSTLIDFSSTEYTTIESSILLTSKVKEKLFDLFPLKDAFAFISFLEQQSYAFIKLTGSRLTVVVIQVPYDALTRWRRITLMSAFFEESQMYAVIRCMHNIQKLGYKINLVDVTDKIISKERQQALLNRFSSATISYVFDTSCGMSKHLYNNGVVFKCDEATAEAEYQLIKEKYQYAKDANSYPSITLCLNDINQVGNIPTLITEENYRTNNIIASLQKESSALSICSPIQAAVELSVDYATLWLKKNKLATSKDLANNEFLQKQILINYNKTLKYPVVDTNTLINKDTQEKYTALYGDVRGLNKYSNFSIISVLSAYNLEASILSWFSQYCVDAKGSSIFKYNAYLDFTLGQYIQTMLRCSLRDTKSTDKVFILVSTKKLAYDLNNVLNNSATVKSPLELFGDNTLQCSIKSSKVYKDVSEEILEKNRKVNARRIQKYRKSKKYLINQAAKTEDIPEKDLYRVAYMEYHFNRTPEYIERRRLTTAISRLNAKLKTNSSDQEAALKKVNLLNARNKINQSTKLIRGKINQDFSEDYAKYINGEHSIFDYLKDRVKQQKLARKQQIAKAKAQLLSY